MTDKTPSKSNKLALTFLIFAGVFWLGAINIRALIQNELLAYDEFAFRISIPPDRENTLFQLISNASLVVLISYIIVLISSIWYLKSTKLKIKENGWLLMCCILFFIGVPVEVYASFVDIKFMILFHSSPPNHDELLMLLGERIGFLKPVPYIFLLQYYTIIPIAVFKPLTRKRTDDKEEKAG
jgi:hypothetical protein